METQEELKKLKAEIRQLRRFVESSNQVFGINEMCDITGATRKEVKKLVKDGKLPVHQFKNGSVYFHGNEIIEALKDAN